MTTTTATGLAPVPFEVRQAFERRLRATIANIAPDCTTIICAAARAVARDFPWADTRTVANALVDILGTGWGAIYLHWESQKADRA